jgi:hypothetical protein
MDFYGAIKGCSFILSAIKILSSFFPAPLVGQSQPEGNVPPLPLGEILQGRVVEQMGLQHAIIKLNGQKLFAETLIPLPIHKDLLFQVEKTEPKIILKLLSLKPNEEPSTLFLKKYLSLDVPTEILAERIASLGKMEISEKLSQTQETFHKFWALLQRFSLPSPSSGEAKPLQQILAQSGLFWENKIKRLIEGKQEDLFSQRVEEDLKGLAMKLRSQLKNEFLPMDKKGENSSRVEEWIRGLDQFVNKMDLYQILNHRHSDPQEKFFFLFPLWFGQTLQFVELNLSLPQGDSPSADSQEFTLVFLLHLPELGKMRIEVKIRGKELFCLFMTSHAKTAQFLRQSCSSLSSRLDHLGFQPHIDVSEEGVEKMNQTLINESENRPVSLLSLKV